MKAAGHYPVPGTPDDPWGPYIREAAARFQVPERWIRAVMRQESGGRQSDADGNPITSSAGAMGLMQVMPRTYDILRQRYGLRDDPYEPHDNILAGAAYIREMFDLYGAPGFLAAYNAGPDRLAAYLAGSESLPDETVNYVASIAPRLGTEVAMSGPLAVYAGGGASGSAQGFGQADAADRAYAGGGMTGQQYAAATSGAAAADPSDRAFDGGGLVTPDAPTGVLATPSSGGPVAAPAPVAVIPAAVAAPARFDADIHLASATVSHNGAWSIQVGAFGSPALARAALAAAQARDSELLVGVPSAIMPVQHAGLLYRARFIGLSAETATDGCGRLASAGVACFAVPPGS